MALGLPNVVIGLVVVALGTSIPEVATCIVAARKGQGALAVGNILGADILNICWIAGASALGQSAGGSGQRGQFYVSVDAGDRADDARVDAH